MPRERHPCRDAKRVVPLFAHARVVPRVARPDWNRAECFLSQEGFAAMRNPSVDDRVRLIKDIPELSLTRGTTGVVRSTWFAPWTAYEVEFKLEGNSFHTRALLMAEQVEVELDPDRPAPAVVRN
jgi:hypothetical protein